MIGQQRHQISPCKSVRRSRISSYGIVIPKDSNKQSKKGVISRQLGCVEATLFVEHYFRSLGGSKYAKMLEDTLSPPSSIAIG